MQVIITTIRVYSLSLKYNEYCLLSRTGTRVHTVFKLIHYRRLYRLKNVREQRQFLWYILRVWLIEIF